MRCRICRTKNNLKFTTQQLRFLSKNSNKNKLRLPLSAFPPTTGNICIDCDERVQNFHELDDDSDDVVDVDSNAFHGNKLRVEMPIIVDDEERLFDMFYNKANLQNKEVLPIQCQSLGSDGDAEVIEVLTSRETSPDPTTGFRSNDIPANPMVIEVIDLENYDEAGKECNGPLPHSNKSMKSEVNESRLLGCLSLLTSDSESEINFEPCSIEETKPALFQAESKTIPLDKTVEYKNNNNLTCGNSNLPAEHNLANCNLIYFDESKKQDSTNEYGTCPACLTHFPKVIDLVCHMRQKHRSYEGDFLCEGSRCSQDSAMTIRLRFKQRFTFYECQLCGLIESQFKVHKNHIIQKHADEAKSLRDPMMKTQLKCPYCLQNCGTQQIDICRHLLTKHEPMISEKYLKEVKEIATLGSNTKYLQNLQHAARFFTLNGHKQYFTECLLCQKVFGSAKAFSHHLNGHNMDEWKEFRTKTSKTTCSPSKIEPKRSLKRKIETRYASKSEFDTTRDILKKEYQPLSKKPRLEYEGSVKNSVKSKKTPLEKNSKPKTEENIAKKSTYSRRLSANTIKSDSLTPTNNKRQKKLRHKMEKNPQNKRRLSKTSIKVKVKPELLQFPHQKYKCKHCQLMFKGFRKLHLHLLSAHRSEEYHSCDSCIRAFTTKIKLDKHRVQNVCRIKRKNANMLQSNYAKSTDNVNLDENSNKDERKAYEHKPIAEGTIEKNLPNQKPSVFFEPTWLKELLQQAGEKEQINIQNSNTAIKNEFPELYLKPELKAIDIVAQVLCRFCGCLFATTKEFAVHEKEHIAMKEMPWIYYSQRTEECSPP